jgi:hypothetical protein
MSYTKKRIPLFLLFLFMGFLINFDFVSSLYNISGADAKPTYRGNYYYSGEINGKPYYALDNENAFLFWDNDPGKGTDPG